MAVPDDAEAGACPSDLNRDLTRQESVDHMQAILERQFPHSKVTLEKVTVREEEKPSEPEPDQRDEVVDHELPF